MTRLQNTSRGVPSITQARCASNLNPSSIKTEFRNCNYKKKNR